MSITEIRLFRECLICGGSNTGFKFTCEYCCDHRMPPRWYVPENEHGYTKILPSHIPAKQQDEFIARYIITNMRIKT